MPFPRGFDFHTIGGQVADEATLIALRDSGLQFAIIGLHDKRAARRCFANCRNVGLPFGAYTYVRYSDSDGTPVGREGWRAQLERGIDIIGETRVAFWSPDVEPYSGEPAPDPRAYREFSEWLMETAVSLWPFERTICYTAEWVYQLAGSPPDWLSRYLRWEARYLAAGSAAPDFDVLDRRGTLYGGLPASRVVLWQYLNTHTLPGTDLPIDANVARSLSLFRVGIEEDGDMWTRFNGVGLSWQQATALEPMEEPGVLACGEDFPGIPDSAKALDLEVWLEPGSRGRFVLRDADGSYAGQVNPVRLQDVIRVKVGKDRSALYQVEQGPVTVALLGIVAYLD